MSAELEERVAHLEQARIDELEAKEARAKKRAKSKPEPSSTEAGEFRGEAGEVQHLDDAKQIRTFIQAVHDGTTGDWAGANPSGVAAIKEGNARDNHQEER